MSAKSAEILEHIAFLKDVDDALSSLLAELRRQGQCAGMCNNLHIIAEAENRLVSLWKGNAEQAQQLRSLRECCDKQVVWIKAAMDAMHPECEVTSNPDSFRGKTFRLHQTGEIERLQEINNNLIEANERLSAKVGDWDAVCKALWDRGYGQLPQRVNETPLGSCLRLIDQGSPEFDGSSQALRQAILKREEPPVNTAWNALMEATREKAKTEGANNPIFAGAGKVEIPWPLKASDLPLGTAIRFPQEPTKEAMILGRSSELVWLAGHGPKGLFLKQLMNDGAEYRLPGTEDWKPCYKLEPRTPPATA